MNVLYLATAAAQIAEKGGWSAVTSVAVARKLGVHSVSVSRSANRGDIMRAAHRLVLDNQNEFPRAAIELRIDELTAEQRQYLLGLLDGETGR